MKDIQISRPVLIAIVGAVLLGGFLLFKGGGEEVAPPPAPAPAASATGATDTAAVKKGKGATGATGASGATGQTTADKQAELKKLRRERLVKAAKESGMPLPVYSAIKDGKVVLIYFYTPQGQDDQTVSENVELLKQYRKGVKPSLVVFKEKISNKSKYDGIADAAELTQTPGIVILYKEDAASAQGYVDADVLNLKITRLTGSKAHSGSVDENGCGDTARATCER